MIIGRDRRVAPTPPRFGIRSKAQEQQQQERGDSSTPMIAKRNAQPCSDNKNNNTRRRVIFPFLPKTPEETTPFSAVDTVEEGSRPSNHCTSTTATTATTSTSENKSSDPVFSPRLECEGVDLQNNNAPSSMPTLPLALLTPCTQKMAGPRLLMPRASTLSSHEESPYSPKKIVSFQTSGSFNEQEEEEDASCPCSAEKVQVILPPSILRRRSFQMGSSQEADHGSSVEKIPLVDDSDVPSLSGSSQSDSCEELRRIFPASTSNKNSTVQATSKSNSTSRAVAFDPRVWVREFERSPEEHQSTWYTNKDLEAFKVAAVERIMAFAGETESFLVPTGTGRMVVPQQQRKKAFFSHQALGTEKEVRREALFRAVMQNELRRILVVDSHDIFLKLFAKTLRPLLPHAEIVLAKSAESALSQAETGRFDLVLVEERLKFLHQSSNKASCTHTLSQNAKDTNTTSTTSPVLPSDEESRSGTALMKRLQEKHGRALYVGVSAKLREDLTRMRQVADVCWAKPPPRMNANLVSDLLHKLLIKRQRFQAVAELFSSTTAKLTC